MMAVSALLLVMWLSCVSTTQVEGRLGRELNCGSVDTTITVANELGVPIEAVQWFGDYGKITVGTQVINTPSSGPSKGPIGVLAGQLIIPPRQTATVRVQSNGGCKGAKGALTFAVKGNSAVYNGNIVGNYTEYTGLNSVVLTYYNNNAKIQDYGATFNQGTVQSQWEESGTLYCTDYLNNVVGIYNSAPGSCNGQKRVCGSNNQLLYNACPNHLTSTQEKFKFAYATEEVTKKESYKVTLQVSDLNISSVPIFHDFKGEWQKIGQNVESITITETVSWSTTNTLAEATGFTFSLASTLTESTKAEFEETSISETATAQWTSTTTGTISHTNGGSKSIAVEADCPRGSLYQWVIQGTSEGKPAYIRTSGFACVPDSSSETVPRCPLEECSDVACTCCKNPWILNNNDPKQNNLCNQ